MDAARSARRHRWLLIAIAAMLLLMAWQTLRVQPAEAHGKQVDIAVTSLIPDPEQPLIRLYRARVTYAADGDPVDGATVLLTARRADGATAFPAQTLTEVGQDTGLYVGEVVFERFGAWEMHLTVQAVLGQGEGSVTFTDDIRPQSLNPDQEAARRAEGERVARLQLQFRFDWWPDVVTIGLRIVHSLAGLAYFLVTGLAFGIAWFGTPSRHVDFPRRLRRMFLPAVATSLGLLLLAGLYVAAFDAPVAWPGIYDIAAMRRIPYGDAYLVAFLVKVALFAVLGVLALRIHRALPRWDASVGPTAEEAVDAGLRRATLLNAAVGVALVIDVAVVIYLHYLSHLGGFLPGP